MHNKLNSMSTCKGTLVDIRLVQMCTAEKDFGVVSVCTLARALAGISPSSQVHIMTACGISAATDAMLEWHAHSRFSNQPLQLGAEST